MSFKLSQELCVITVKIDAKCLLGTDLSFQTWHEKFDEFWPEHSKFSRTSTLNGSFWTKYVMFELRKCWWFIFHDTEEWWKIWGKTDLWLGKWHEEFDKFSKSTRMSENWDFDGILLSKGEIMSLRFTEELCIMAMNNDAKFKEQLTCGLQIDMSNSTNFVLNTRNSQKFAL